MQVNKEIPRMFFLKNLWLPGSKGYNLSQEILESLPNLRAVLILQKCFSAKFPVFSRLAQMAFQIINISRFRALQEQCCDLPNTEASVWHLAAHQDRRMCLGGNPKKQQVRWAGNDTVRITETGQFICLVGVLSLQCAQSQALKLGMPYGHPEWLAESKCHTA